MQVESPEVMHDSEPLTLFLPYAEDGLVVGGVGALNHSQLQPFGHGGLDEGSTSVRNLELFRVHRFFVFEMDSVFGRRGPTEVTFVGAEYTSMFEQQVTVFLFILV